MNRTLLKIISLFLALALTASLAGCSLELPWQTSEEDAAPAPEETADPEDTEGQDTDEDAGAEEEEEEEPEEAGEPGKIGGSIGEELQATYQADHIFSVNTMAGESFNPYTTESAWNRMTSMLIYETLVAADGNFEAQPNLITRWESTPDGLAWTFYVDTSRKFHDGGVMTPGDAVYSLDQARSAYGGRYAKRFAHVRNVYVAGEEAFVVELDQPNWRFYELMNIPCIETGTMGTQPSGTGPYKLDARGTSLVLDKNHPKAKDIPLDTIHLKRYTDPEDILQAFEDSLLDMVTNNPADMSSLGYSSANLIKYVDTTNLHYLGYNANSTIFSQPVYRAMITYAIDRESIISTSYQGSAVEATLPIHPNSTLYPKSLAASLAYSPENLSVSMQNAGAQDLDMDGVIDFGIQARGEIVFLVCSDSAAKVAAARQIATQLRNAGFAVTMSELEYNDYIKALTEGTYDIYYGEVKICNDWDVSQLVAAGGELNYGGIRDPNLEGYIQAFISSPPESIQANTEALYTYFAQVAPITTICFERMQVLYHRGVLTTISPTQDNIFNEIENWSVDLGEKEK